MKKKQKNVFVKIMTKENSTEPMKPQRLWLKKKKKKKKKKKNVFVKIMTKENSTEPMKPQRLWLTNKSKENSNAI